MKRFRGALETAVDFVSAFPWSVLIVPLAIWGIGVPAFVFGLDYPMSDALDELTFAMYIVGLVIIAALGGFVMALAIVHEDLPAEGEARGLVDPREIDTPAAAIPEGRHRVWTKLSERYGAGFASWFLLHAEGRSDERALERQAAARWPEWRAEENRPTRNEYVDALHEAALVVVGATLGREPEFAVIPDEDPWDDFGDLQHSHTRFLMTMPPISDEDDSWNAALTAAAGAVVERERFQAARGDHRDLAEVRDACLAIVAGAKPPSGYAGELTLSALTARALHEAGEILERHDRALRAIAHELASHRVLGGRELLRIFREHPAADL